jgi:tripartite-type tricarboxylate transporter receptor subunit TctC
MRKWSGFPARLSNEANIRRLCHCLSCLLVIAGAAAQPYPSKPVRWILPAAAGGSNDTAARLVAPRLSEALGQPVVVDNRGGAGGNIAMEVVSKAAPDGYTIAQVSTIQAMNASFYRNLQYDLMRDMAPVAELISLTTVMVVHPSVPARNPAELIAYARANPGKLNFVSGTNGATGHYLKYLTGVDMTIVLYKGTPPAVTELVGGQGHVMVATSSDVMPFVKIGKLRALALSSSMQRSPLFPELPPLADTVPGFEQPIWYGVIVPLRTPAAVIRRLHAEFTQIMRNTELRQRLNALGYEVTIGTTEQFGQRIRNEVAKWPNVVQAMGGPIN